MLEGCPELYLNRGYAVVTKRLVRALLAFGLIAVGQPGQADEYPSRWVRFIVPYGAGGSGDTLARMVAQHMSTALGQQFVIENRAGAGGIIGTQQFISATPDGYTIGMTNLSSLTLVPLINPKGSYEPSVDFTHIAYIGGAPVVLSSSIASQVKTIADFISYGKSPGKAFMFATSGVASDGHLMGEAIAMSTGVKAEHLPYKATAQALTDLVGGQIPFATFTLSSTAPFLRTKSVNGIAVTTENRLEEFPDVPTFKELGYPELIGTTWFALSGPPKMPKEIVQKLNRAVIAAVNSPEVQSRFRQNGFISRDLTAEEFARFVTEETSRWKPVVHKAGLEGQGQ
jgi:tripartite-type tricarboxylate transporter receptor subunit TctC